MSEILQLWYVVSSTGNDANTYLWASEDGQRSIWGISTNRLEQRLLNSNPLYKHKSFYPYDEFIHIHTGTIHECLQMAKTNALIGIGDLDEVNHVMEVKDVQVL